MHTRFSFSRTVTHKIDEGNVEKHANGCSEDPLTGDFRVGDQSANQETNDRCRSREKVPQQCSAM